MKFRRKSSPVDPQVTAPVEPEPLGPGPYDVSANGRVGDDIDRVDVGALLIAPMPGCELRLQVDEKSGDVTSVLLAAEEGAMDLQAFAAPRNGDLWSEIRPQIAADVERRGGRHQEQEGPFGTELFCQVPARRADGTEGVQQSRVIGINGPRWLLRATLLGKPAVDPEVAKSWEHGLQLVGVRRGEEAMPVGRQLSMTLPPDAERSS